MLATKATKGPDYLRFMAVEDGSSVKLTVAKGTPTGADLEYSLNGNAWTAYTVDDTISLDKGDYVLLRRVAGAAIMQLSTGSTNYYQFVMTGTIQASGNIMSLLDATCQAVKASTGCFYALFDFCSQLVTAPYCPATTINVNSAYSYMFRGCTGIVSHKFATIGKMNDVFKYNTDCRVLRIDAATPPEINETTISGLKSDCAILVPAASVTAYKEAQYWSDRADYITAK